MKRLLLYTICAFLFSTTSMAANMKEKNNTKKQIKIYFSAPLFTQAELSYNLRLAALLSEKHRASKWGEKFELSFVIPQLSIQESKTITPSDIAKNDLQLCDISDGGIFLVDLADVDSGCAVEYAYMRYALNKPTLLIRTDFRSAEIDSKINCMFREDGKNHIYQETNGMEFYLKHLSNPDIVDNVDRLNKSEAEAYQKYYVDGVYASIAKLFFEQ